jgi:hypothetical protein
MARKFVSMFVCILLIITLFTIAAPATTKITSRSPSIIDYQIGVKLAGQNDNWSPWSSDGGIARVTTFGMSGTMDFLTRVNASGYHVKYQIGIKIAGQNDNWSPWSSDGNIARVTTFGLSGTMDFVLRIISPGCYVEYQIGVRLSNQNDNWSPKSSDGGTARVTTNGFTGTMDFMMKATMIVPVSAVVDIDPDTLNLKSKGRWVTTYIELPDGYNVSDINVATVNISDINGQTVDIPALSHPTEIGDHDNDNIPDLMVKFDRLILEDNLNPGNATIKITGKFNDGTEFEGSDTIGVIKPGKSSNSLALFMPSLFYVV